MTNADEAVQRFWVSCPDLVLLDAMLNVKFSSPRRMSQLPTTAAARKGSRSAERRGAERVAAGKIFPGLGYLPAITLIIAATAVAFLPLLANQFVNWDDPFTIQNNAHLAGRGLVPWAFTTLEMGHYQPLAWLAWGAVRAIFGLNPTAFHALSLVGHLLNCGLVFLVTLRLTRAARLDDDAAHAAALLSTLVFALHPLRVEAVAWASAFPYVLSLGFTLLAVLAYMQYCSRADARLLVASIFFFALSLLSRANALDLPFALIVLDVYPLRRVAVGLERTASPRSDAHTRTSWGRLFAEKIPFIVLAVAAAVIESSARDIPSLREIGPTARVSIALSAPFKYVARTFAPFRLTPIDLLPLEPTPQWLLLACSAAGLVGITALAWKLRAKWPALGAAWCAYLVLLLPLLGLTPSGQQEAADRYMYLPGVVVSLAIGVAAAKVVVRRRWLAAIAAVLLCVIGAMTWRQITWWHDSMTLWTRAIELDPRNDLATYNLAIALDNAGRVDEAIARYNDTLRLVPDQEIARRNRDKLIADQAEREGDRLARAANLAGAVDAYSRALASDAGRAHARAARGISLVRAGRFSDATSDLKAAFAKSPDQAVANALAFVFVQSGRFREAIETLKVALKAHADDVEIAGNLARLLATAPDRETRDPALALQLALGVRAKTGGNDPRVLDTLAAAYAANGQRDLARRVLEEAIGAARQRGDPDLAADLMSHERSYGR